MGDILYHYCPTEKCFSILSNHSLRMSDIGKSNDSMELQLFFPELQHRIWDLYRKDPFTFRFHGQSGGLAMRELLFQSEILWRDRLEIGTYSNYVLCFSEKSDLLSQWRGYANDAKGCCIGFSKEVIESFCDSTNGVLRFEKVEYVSDNDLALMITNFAQEVIEELKTLQSWFKKNAGKKIDAYNYDNYIGFNFNEIIKNCFAISLKYKKNTFKEENEWRIFLANTAVKNPKWLYNSTDQERNGPPLFYETLDFLRNRTDFWWSEDNLVSYCTLQFNEFPEPPVKELWFGPKNKTQDRDAELFLNKYGYNDVELHHSRITYR